MINDFPMMIYHIQLGQKIVKDKFELELAEGRGWIKNYEVFQKKNTIDERLKYHQDELEKLMSEKKKYLANDGKNVTITSDSVVIEKEETDEAKPKRGRPRKEV